MAAADLPCPPAGRRATQPVTDDRDPRVMARRADPERIDEARRAALRNALTGSGMSPEVADRWLAGWADEAALRGLQQGGAYWTAAATWIAAERVRRRGAIS